jgi:hypothetical protein
MIEFIWTFYNLLTTFHYASELLGVWTFFPPSSGILRDQKTRRFGNWICFRPQVRGEDTQLGPLERTNLDHWTTPVRLTKLKGKLRGFSPQVNYADRATAAYRRS